MRGLSRITGGDSAHAGRARQSRRGEAEQRNQSVIDAVVDRECDPRSRPDLAGTIVTGSRDVLDETRERITMTLTHLSGLPTR